MSVLHEDTFFRSVFDVGLGAEITGATPNHRSVSTGKDDGTLSRLGRIRGATRTHGSAADIGEMFDWVSADQPRFVHLIGHGNSGQFDVGDGQNVCTTTGTIHSTTSGYWREHLRRLSKYDENRQIRAPADDVQYSGGLMLEGCCVAAGLSGACLMKDLADTTLRTVFAYTGLISVRNNRSVWFEKGHVWMRQDPLASAATIEARPAPMDKSLLRTVSLAEAGLNVGMEAEDVLSVEVTYVMSGYSVVLPAEEAQLLFAQLFYSKAFKPEGRMLGIVTHRFRITYRDQPGLGVDLLAQRVAETSAGISFLVGPDLADLLDRLEH